MSQIEKLLQRFMKTPHAIKYTDIEKILTHVGFKKIHTKGSHVKWKHQNLIADIVVPVHDNDCKRFYKQQIKRQIQSLIN